MMKKILLLMVFAAFYCKQTYAADFCVQVPVLMYHHIQDNATAAARGQIGLTVSPANFEKQVAYFAHRGTTFATLDDIYHALKNHTTLSNTVAITFDDGYVDVYQNALPILQKYGAKGNLFFITGLAGVNDAHNHFLTWDEVQTMKNAGTFSLYNHTWSHYNMLRGSYDKKKTEVLTAEDQLRSNHVHAEVAAIAYPWGGVNASGLQATQDSNIQIGFTTKKGTKLCESNILKLPRVRIGNAPSLPKLF